MILVILAMGVFLVGCQSTSTSVGRVWGHLNHGRYGAASVTDGHYIYVLGGSDATYAPLPVERFDPISGEVEVMPWQTLPRRYLSAVWADGAIWVFGGESPTALVPEIERIDPITGAVSIVGTLHVPRRHMSVAQLDGTVYLVGGIGRGEEQDGRGNTVERFDPHQGKTTLGPPLPEAVLTKVAAAGGKLYALGTWTQAESTSRRAYVLDETKNWQRLPDLPWPLSAQTMVGAGEQIYSFGDYVEMGRVVRYDVKRSRAEKLPVNYTPRRHATSVILGHQVYVIGGNIATRQSALDTIEVFSLADLRRLHP